MNTHCLTIVGARPQFIKAAAVSRLMKAAGIRERIVHTGQHYDYNMSKVFFQELGIREPDYNLGVGSLHHGAQTGRMMEKIEEIITKEKPHIVLVYGDTNSTLAGALAAAKLHVPVAHVEAGLRSYNKMMPEEINRVLTDHISDILFCPTVTAVKNLMREGFRNIVNKGKLVADSGPVFSERQFPCVINVGDVMYDSVICNLEIAKKKSKILENYSLSPKNYYLATIHRAENTDDPHKLKSIFGALRKIAKIFPLIIPIHPRTLKRLDGAYGNDKSIRIIPPASYLDMLMLLGSSRIVLTDSGGVQKEAFFLNVPCVTLRHETEWIETLKNAMNVLSGSRGEDIIRAVDNHESKLFSRNRKEFFGNGQAANKIVRFLQEVII
jgi:UDP-N-acetylglucosamine 2-epimerase